MIIGDSATEAPRCDLAADGDERAELSAASVSSFVVASTISMIASILESAAMKDTWTWSTLTLAKLARAEAIVASLAAL